MNNTALKINQLFFHYGKKQILNDINFSVSQGEYVSVIGPNGAGKSTLLKCINRITKGPEGSIELFGKNLNDYSQKDLGRMIGYVSQTSEQLFPFTVFEFVLMGRYPYRSPLSRVTKQDKAAIDQALSMTGLTDFVDRKVNTLSGGERQKVYLAGALAQQPKILLLDEPTAHLDPKYHAEIQKTISDICAHMGMTILHVTHDLNHIFSWSQKVIAIKEGRLYRMGVPEVLLTPEYLKDIFETDFLVMSHPITSRPIIVPEFRL